MKRTIYIFINLLFIISINDLKGASPNWNVNPHEFAVNMTGVIRIKMDSVFYNRLDTRIAVFVGSQLRGIVNVNAGKRIGTNIYYPITMYSNLNKGDIMSFKIYEAPNDTVYNADETLVFDRSKTCGKFSQPFILTIHPYCTAPIFTTCPPNVTFNTAIGVCGSNYNYTPIISGFPTPTIKYYFSGATTGSGTGTGSGAYFNFGITTVKLVLDNNCKPKDSCTFTIKIIDVEKPTMVCKANQNRGTNAPLCTYTMVGTEFDLISKSDNCGLLSTTYTVTGVTTSSGSNSLTGLIFNKGISVVTWSVTDINGNLSTCKFNVNVVDDDPSIISCKVNQSRGTTGSLCSYTAVGTEFDLTSSTDNCGIESSIYTLSGATTGTGSNSLANFVFVKGVTTVLWTVTDVGSNISTCKFTVTIVDDDNPTLVCKTNTVVSTTGNTCKYTAVGNEFDLTSNSDNCGISTKTYTLSGATTGTGSTTLAAKVFNLGVTTVLWKVTDAAGNSATCNFVVTVLDIKLPSLTCKANQTRTSGTYACKYITVGTEFNLASSSDNCGIASTVYTLTGVTTGTGNNSLAGIQFNIGTTTVEWKVTDAAGNSKACNFTVIINDIDSDCDGVLDCTDVCHGGNDTIDNDGNGLPDCKYPPTYAKIIAAWKCGSNKAYICHSNGTQCVAYSAVATHIAHGDYLGSCDNSNCGGWTLRREITDDLSAEADGLPSGYADEISMNHAIEIYPNPAQNMVYIKLPKQSNDEVNIQMYNTMGIQLMNDISINKKDNRIIQVDIAGIPNGLCYFKIKLDDMEFIKSVSIQK